MNIGDKVRIKGNMDGKVFVIEDISQDREGNELITSMVNYENEDDYSDLTWYPEELELVEDEPVKSIKFPHFKSYGLSIDQTCEVVENYINWQKDIMVEMAKEANDDDNLGMLKGYVDDLNILLAMKERLDSFNYRLRDYNAG